MHTARVGYSRTRIGQNVEANTSQPLPVFVPGRDSMGAIDIGGVPRFGPQSSANLRLRQDVVSGQYDVAQSRGRHLLKAGALVEHYLDDELNPTFSLGIYRFANLSTFLRNVPASFIGLTPQGDFTRHWDWTLYGVYAQDDFAVSPRADAQSRSCASRARRCPAIARTATSTCRICCAAAPTVGPLYENPGAVLVAASRAPPGIRAATAARRCAAATGSTSTPTISRT